MTETIDKKVTEYDPLLAVTAGGVPALADGDVLYVAHSALDKNITVGELTKALRLREVVATSFAAAIPLDSNRQMPAQIISSVIAFTVASGAVAQGRCYVRLQADGAHAPTFTGFTEHSSSTGFVNTDGVKNYVAFWSDGTEAFYAVTTSKADAPFDGAGADGFNVVLIGDSIGFGSGAAFMQMDTEAGAVRLNNAPPLAVGGSTIAAALKNYGPDSGDTSSAGLGPYYLQQYYDPTRTNIVFIQRGTNSLNGGSPQSAATITTQEATLITRAKADGWIVVIVTVLNRGDTDASVAPWTDAMQTQLGLLNTARRAKTSGADIVCDIQAVTALQDPTNTTYHLPDKLHLTSAGQALLVPVYQAALDAAKLVTRRRPTLGTLTLDRSIYPGTPTTGKVNGINFHSSVATSVVGLSVNFRLGTFAWDGSGSSGTTTAGLVETLFGDAHSSPITVASGSAPNYLRLVPRPSTADPDLGGTNDVGTDLAETGDAGSGYIYTTSGSLAADQGYGGPPGSIGNWTDQALAADTEGWIQAVSPGPLPDAEFSMFFGFVDTTSGHLGTNIVRSHPVLGAFVHSGFGNKYNPYVGDYGSPTTTIAVAANHLVRVERLFANGTDSSGGFTGRVRVSTTGLVADFQTIYTLNGMTAHELVPYFATGHGGSGGRIVHPEGSQSIA